MAEPHNGELLQEGWSALSGTLPGGSLMIDMGSATADRAAGGTLRDAGWSSLEQERMLMVKGIED
jgi:hypothetical protein